MVRPFQPLIQDKDRSIRKDIDRIYKKSGMTKSRIAEMAIKKGLTGLIMEIPELSADSK